MLAMERVAMLILRPLILVRAAQQLARVAPVVRTSSTRRIWCPSSSSG